ncbi:MAG: hypothetical protein QOF02_2833 [Blastocatellia bacterium]|jgi:hypothetical protein|nr:hypothetical protein [Blastocatellia bacterium]
MQRLSRLFALVSLHSKIKRRIAAPLAAVVIVFCWTGAVKADPLTISSVQGGFYNLNTGELRYVDLGSNPNHVFNFTGPLIGYGPEQISYVAFRIQIPGITGPRTETLHITFTQTGGNSPTPPPINILDIGAFGPTDGYGMSAPFTGGYYEGAPFSYAFVGSINIVLRDSMGQVIDSFSSNFSVNRVIPVPEPVSLLLLGTGLAGVAARLRGKRQARRS